MTDSGREDLVRRNLPLVGHLVRETLSRVPGRVSGDDLRSAAMLALVRAAESFDAARDGGFTAYATGRIRSALLDDLRGLDWAGARPVPTVTPATAGPAVRQQLTAQPGRDTSLSVAVRELPEQLRAVVEGYFFAGRPMDELAAELGLSERELAELRTEAVRRLGGALGALSAPRAVRPGKASFYASIAAHRGAAPPVPYRRTETRRPA